MYLLLLWEMNKIVNVIRQIPGHDEVSPITVKRGNFMEARQNVNPHELAEKVRSHEETAHQQGNILRLKQGYNPNSSSIGSVIFVLPAALLGITAAFGAVSGMIMSTLMADKAKNTKDTNTPTEGEIDE